MVVLEKVALGRNEGEGILGPDGLLPLTGFSSDSSQ